MKNLVLVGFGVMSFTGAATAQKQPAAPACPAVAAPLPADLAGWATPAPAAAAAASADLGKAQLAIGQRADVKLLPTSQVAYVMHPEKPGKIGRAHV